MGTSYTSLDLGILFTLRFGEEKFYFPKYRLVQLSHLVQDYCHDHPHCQEIEIPLLSGFTSYDLSNLLLFFDTFVIPEEKEEALALYRFANYFHLVDKYIEILQDLIRSLLWYKFNDEIIFNPNGSSSPYRLLSQWEREDKTCGIIRNIPVSALCLKERLSQQYFQELVVTKIK